MLHPVVPVFGLVVVGLPGAVVTLGLAATCAALAYATLRVETRGWWGSMALMILLGASTAVTFAFGDPDVLFETLAPSGGQGSILAESAPLLVWGTIAITVMSILYMFMIRRHFPFDRR